MTTRAGVRRLVVLGVVCGLPLVACGQEDGSGEEIDRLAERIAELEQALEAPSITVAPPPSTDLEEADDVDVMAVPGTALQSAGPESTVPALEVPPDPVALLADARDRWETHRVGLGDEAVVSSVELVRDVPVVASWTGGDLEDAEPLWVWQFDGAWNVADEIYDLDGLGLANVMELGLHDVTEDGSAELVVLYSPNRTFGAAHWWDGSVWELAVWGENLRLVDGRLLGSENSCDPNCAEGTPVEYQVLWTGDEFERVYPDPTPVAVEEPPPVCPTYAFEEYEPFALCDRGPAIAYLQEALVFFDYLEPGPNAADGFFGPATERAVRALQRDYEVLEDGVVTGWWYYDFISTYNLMR